MTKQKNNIEADKLRLEYIFGTGVDFRNRVIRISGYIGGSGMMDESDYCDFSIVDSALTEMERLDPESPVIVRINSGGGSVYEGLAIVGRLKASPCKIITEGYGHVMSAATLILACGDERKISKYCISMFHQSSYGISGSHEEVKDHVQQAEREEKLWSKWISEMSGKTSNFWYKTLKKKNVYLSAEQMLEYEVVDEII